MNTDVKKILEKINPTPLTSRDIEGLLLAYSGAIALDQIRVDRLPVPSKGW